MSEPSTAMTVELECNNNAFVFADGEPISQGLLHGAPKPPQATVPTSSSTEDPGDLTQRPCLGDITSTYMAYYAEVNNCCMFKVNVLEPASNAN